MRKKDIPVFPDIIPDRETMSVRHDIRNDDIQTEDDLRHLLVLMFDHPERSFHYFNENDNKPNEPIAKARDDRAILMNDAEYFHYKRPKNKHDFVKIPHNGGQFEWQKDASKQEPMFVRIKLSLTERVKRRLEVITKNEIEKTIDNFPLKIKPTVWGIRLDVPRLWRWIRNTLRR